MFPFLTLPWSWDSCCWSMSKDDHFPVVGFVWQAFLFSVRFLLPHPVLENFIQSFWRSIHAAIDRNYIHKSQTSFLDRFLIFSFSGWETTDWSTRFSHHTNIFFPTFRWILNDEACSGQLTIIKCDRPGNLCTHNKSVEKPHTYIQYTTKFIWHCYNVQLAGHTLWKSLCLTIKLRPSHSMLSGVLIVTIRND